MINVRDNIWKPSEGYKYISNGDIFASEIHLNKNDNIANWNDTNDEPPEPEEPATPEEYDEQLARLGVNA